MKFPAPFWFAAALGAAASAAAQAPTASAAATATSLSEALTRGKVSVNARLRFESVNQDATSDAEALTARLRLGYTTQSFNGFQAMIEGEAVTPLVDDYFDGTGTNAAGHAVIGDPEVYDLNQAWVSYTFEQTKGTLGRQKLVLDNARFIGDVGWRQNDQTFDALVVQSKTLPKTVLTYAYIDYVNRVFDDSGVQPNWDSNSHVLNASYTGLPIGTLTGYAFLLDFDAKIGAGRAGALSASSATYGLSLAGARPVSGDVKATYRLEFATQTDYADSPLNYDANYYLGEIGAAFKTSQVAVGYEVLGSDDGVASFRTPPATLHAHNGWADVFLITPAAGLTDTYLKAGTTVAGKVTLLAFYHLFGTEDGDSRIGDEIDVMATYKVSKELSVTAKVAKFWGDPGYADRSKIWFQVDYAF